MPTAAAAFSIGTAKPMPMNTRWLVGLRMPVTMPTTSPSAVTSGPPELPGLAAASNWMRLVRMRLPSVRVVLALQPRHDAGRGRRADAERKAHGDHLVADREIRGRAQRRRDEVVGHGLRLQHREVVLGPHADDRRVGFHAVEEAHLDPLGADDDVQVGEDDALVDDHDARCRRRCRRAGSSCRPCPCCGRLVRRFVRRFFRRFFLGFAPSAGLSLPPSLRNTRSRLFAASLAFSLRGRVALAGVALSLPRLLLVRRREARRRPRPPDPGPSRARRRAGSPRTPWTRTTAADCSRACAGRRRRCPSA